jgi:hypothetical protein
MKTLMQRYQQIFSLIILFLLFGFYPWMETQGHDNGSTYLTLLKEIEVGGYPSAIVVDSSGESKDAIFYGSDKIRFIDGDSLELAPEELEVPTNEWEGWLAYDRTHGYAYAVTTRMVWESSIQSWEELRVTVINDREYIGGFSLNQSYNLDPTNLVDLRIDVEGLEIKPAQSEGNNPTRLIVDDNYNGILHVVDLNSEGTDLARVQRGDYRPALTDVWRQDNPGNSLALETKHETLSVDDLANDDLLYIADLNDGADDGYITVVRLTHPLQDLQLTALPKVDLSETWPFTSYGLKGIMMAEQRDVLYVSSAQQSFNEGYIGTVNTTNNQVAHVVSLTYSDQGNLLVNWADPQMVFVPTFDGFYNDPDQGLYLTLVYNDQEVDRLLLEKDHDEYERVRGMTYDPDHQCLYLTVGSKVLVVGVNYGMPYPLVYKNYTYIPLIVR